MAKLLLPLVAGVLVATAAPATAQTWRPRAAATSEIRQDIDQLERRISRAEQRGTITRREAARLRRELAEFRQLYRQYNRNGLNRTEVSRLEREANQIRAELRLSMRDWDGRR